MIIETSAKRSRWSGPGAFAIAIAIVLTGCSTTPPPAPADIRKQAMEQIRTEFPHFILSDLSMPNMDGWGLIHALQSDPQTTSIPVIALTAHAMLGDRERVMRAGFTSYLTKPLDPATFIPHLVRLLAEVPEFAPVLRPYLMETTGEQ